MTKDRIMAIIQNSDVLRFFSSINRNMVIYVRHSRTYDLCISLNKFFKNNISKNASSSLIVRFFSKAAKAVLPEDVGLFIILCVLFNTLIMVSLHKVIDLFSVIGRIALLAAGCLLLCRKKQVSNG